MEKERRKEILQSYKERPMSGGVFVIQNLQTGKKLLSCETNLAGSRNRFTFSQQTGSCLYHQLARDWRTYGPNAFSFTILEEITQKETQSVQEFKDDLTLLKELWTEKLSGEDLY